MEILQLKYFYALASTEHVTKTAEKLHIAQPALTQTIHRLEKELGVKLFKSSGRNIVLTESGVYLRNKLEPILKGLNEIPEELKNFSDERNRMLIINVLAASDRITESIIEYKATHENISFQLVQNSQSENADITVFTKECFQKPKNKEDNYYVFTEKIYLAVPNPSEYSSKKSIDLKNMAGKSFISLAGSRSLRVICDRFCMHSGFMPNVVFESDSPSAVKNLIGAGLGVGFWPEYSWGEYDRENMALIDISEPVCQRDIVVQLNDSRIESQEAREYFEFLKNYFEKIKNFSLN